MDLNEKKIKKLKTQFLIFSFLGFILLSLVSLLILNYHEKEIIRQNFFQEYTSLLREELRQVREIGLNFKSESDQKNNERKKDLKAIQGSLKKRTSENLDYFKTYPQFSKRMSEFHSLINHHLIAIYQGAIFEASHKERQLKLEEMMDKFLLQLDQLRQLGRTQIRYLGWLTVGISFFLVIIFWFSIFKPLFITIYDQNLRISEYAEKIQEGSIAKENFLMNISHEIRTPMTAILGYADLLKSNEIEMEEVPKTIGIIDKNANHLLTLIDELLDLNKVRTDKFEYEL
ncbi:MAG: hypothetical protein NXH75_09920, partial [Halobacteriovoraceae bacterium]|nr:hypothetical protein [Halobacteriovoraceae bacterium]